VIASQQEEVFGKLDLVAEQEQNRLERLFASVDVIAQKQVIRLGRESAHLEQSNQVGILGISKAQTACRLTCP
jgi:hypothetical protein